jgi:hypothetical protein
MKTKKINYSGIDNSFIFLLKTVLIIIVFLNAVSLSNAQFIYIDIDPDTTISDSGGYYNLDLNNNGTDDFKISRYTYMDYNAVDLQTLHDSCYASCYSLETAHFANAYSFNDSIGNFSPWVNSSGAINIANYGGMTTIMHPGAFLGEVDKCLGLMLVTNNNTYYAWVRIDVASDASWFKMKDYAYNNTTLFAGQMTTSMNETAKKPKDFELYYSNNEVVLKNINNKEIINAKLYNQSSQLIKDYGIVKKDIHINKTNFKNGLYFLVIETKKQIKTLKILVN